MKLAELIKAAYNHDAVVVAYIYGGFGFGKTSYALWTAYEVLGSWNRVLQHLFFSPAEAVDAMQRAVDRGRRLPIIIMDDAGLWLDKMTWWERDKVAFMQFFNLIRSVAAGVIFTAPDQDLPRNLARKIMFRVSVAPVSAARARRVLVERLGEEGDKAFDDVVSLLDKLGLKKLFAIATIYRLRTLPSFMQLVRKEFHDIFPLHYPVYESYMRRRMRAVREYLARWRKTVGVQRPSREELMRRAAELLAAGKTRREVVQLLVDAGISKRTAYRWVQKLMSGDGGGG